MDNQYRIGFIKQVGTTSLHNPNMNYLLNFSEGCENYVSKKTQYCPEYR